MLKPLSYLRNAIQQLRWHLLDRLAKIRRLNGWWSGRQGSPRVLPGLSGDWSAIQTPNPPT